jgi:catechol 2,3-dioxygenase-like lactoylglutathione lyase family enzyme
MSETLGVDHVGLAVRDLARSAAFFTGLLGFEKVGERPDYPAIFVSDGQVMITLWQVSDPATARPFDRHGQVGLHHLALRLESQAAVRRMHERLVAAGIEIESPPVPLASGAGLHLMCREPGGIRIEFIARG